MPGINISSGIQTTSVETGLARLNLAVTRFKANVVALSETFQGLRGAIDMAIHTFEDLRGALDFGAQFHDLAEQSGASAGQMAVLSQGLKNAGGGAESAEVFTKKLGAALSGLNEEGTQTTTAFRQLGVNIGSLRTMSAVERVEALGAAFRRLPNANDRIKIATDLLGKSGAQDLPLFLNSDAMKEAKDQIGGLRGVLDRSADSFARLAHSLDAVGIKATQFFAGFAEGLDGDTKNFANWLNKIDLTGFGKRMGEIAKQIGEFLAKLRPLLPWLGLLAARFLFAKLGVDKFIVSLVAGLANPTMAVSLLTNSVARLNVVMAALRAPSIVTGLGQIAGAIGTLNMVLLAGVAIWAAWEAGARLRKFTPWGSHVNAADAQKKMTDMEGGLFGRFSKTKGQFASTEDRAAFLKSIDEAMKKERGQLSRLPKMHLGHEDFRGAMATGNTALHQLELLKSRAGKAPINPVKAPYDPQTYQMAPWLVSGRSPISHLGRVGGGINMIGAGSDPVLNEAKRQTMLLQGILTTMTGSPTGTRAPVNHPIGS